jgi:hypothetical protein
MRTTILTSRFNRRWSFRLVQIPSAYPARSRFAAFPGRTLTLTVSGEGTGSGEIKGVMAFDRKDYGMNSGIPFIHIANRVEVDVDLHVKRVSGPPLNFKQ